MKKLSTLVAGIAGLVLLALATPAFAAEHTITGEAKCAKCSMHESDKCQTVIQAEHRGKMVTYYLADNDVAKNFHDQICKEPKKVKATGTIKTVDGKQEMTVSKIEEAK